jgi:alpha-D-ribose 1-methylphosphonate 5-triphosphate synthase subunit PhnH
MLMPNENIWRAEVQQRVFRALVEAFSRPGQVQELAIGNEHAVTHNAVLATLLDGETSLADPHALLGNTDWPLLQARQAPPDTARYVLVDGHRAPDFQPALGTLASPEFGATLLINVDALGRGPLATTLTGPGIAQRRELQVAGLHVAWLQQRANWVAGFPLGVDIILCAATRIAALPRTTRISITAMTKGAA